MSEQSCMCNPHGSFDCRMHNPDHPSRKIDQLRQALEKAEMERDVALRERDEARAKAEKWLQSYINTTLRYNELATEVEGLTGVLRGKLLLGKEAEEKIEKLELVEADNAALLNEIEYAKECLIECADGRYEWRGVHWIGEGAQGKHPGQGLLSQHAAQVGLLVGALTELVENWEVWSKRCRREPDRTWEQSRDNHLAAIERAKGLLSTLTPSATALVEERERLKTSAKALLDYIYELETLEGADELINALDAALSTADKGGR